MKTNATVTKITPIAQLALEQTVATPVIDNTKAVSQKTGSKQLRMAFVFVLKDTFEWECYAVQFVSCTLAQ